MLVMELAKYGSLDKFAKEIRGKEGCFSEKLFEQMLINISTGMKICHEYGLYHYDIKPPNILVCWNATQSQYIFKVADIGIILIKNYLNNFERWQHFDGKEYEK